VRKKGTVVVSGTVERKKCWPVWPALLLELFKIIIADKAKVKEKGGENTMHASFKGALH
jgi:hypothetical protein